MDNRKQIESLVDTIVLHDEDEQAHAFIRFCSLLTECVRDPSEVENVLITARDRAYTRTLHFSQSVDTFDATQPNNENTKEN